MPKVADKKSSSKAPAKKEKGGKSTEKREPSAYNLFMKAKLPEYKAKHPNANHKEAFAAVATLWKNASENPNRGK